LVRSATPARFLYGCCHCAAAACNTRSSICWGLKSGGG
jgi:hypothetical protein